MHLSPTAADLIFWLRKSELGSMRKIPSAFVVWKMEGACGQDLSPASSAKSAPLILVPWNTQLLSSSTNQAPPDHQQHDHQSYNPEELNSAYSVGQFGSGFFPEPPDESQAQLIA